MSKLVKKELKLKKPHPANRFYVGKHCITQVYQTFEMNEAELKELQTPGPKYWVQEKEEKPAKSDKKE
jgi:hypothetical protein